MSKFFNRKSAVETTEVSADEGLSSSISIEREAVNLEKFQKAHKWDLFMDVDKLDTVDRVVASGDVEKEAALEDSLLEEDSPYAEVRASVSASSIYRAARILICLKVRPTDDPELPVDTIRAWTIGAITCTVVGACNVLLALRPEQLYIPSTVVQLIAYPMGTAWHAVMPTRTYSLFGKQFSLNPGPFNMKEHTIITAMTAAGTTLSYAIDILLAQEVFYGQEFGWGYQLMLTMSTQALGFGLAGVTRRFLVWPA